jgi:hypothetical protein
MNGSGNKAETDRKLGLDGELLRARTVGGDPEAFLYYGAGAWQAGVDGS